MSIELEFHRWHRKHIEFSHGRNFTQPLRLTDFQALLFLKAIIPQMQYRDDILEFEAALYANRPWDVMTGMHYMGHPVIRIPPQG